MNEEQSKIPIDAVEEFHARMRENEEIQDMRDAEGHPSPESDDPLATLRVRREQLKQSLRDLDAELGEGRTDRIWLRKIPDWFWFPVNVTNHVLNSQTAHRRARGHPNVYHWQRHADMRSFGVNILLLAIYLVFVFSALGLLL